MNPTEQKGFRLLEILAAVVLSASTLLTAWSAYQSARWSGLQTIHFTQATSTRTESLRASTQAGQDESVDVAAFTAWLQATDQGQTHLASLLEARFSPTLKSAFEQWEAQSPLTNPKAPLTPFDLSSYGSAARASAAELETEAGNLFQEATEDNRRSDDYVLMTVLFSVSMFVDAISSRFAKDRILYVLMGLSVAVFLGATVITATFPIKL